MVVLKVHNYYQQRGGEDETFDSEVALLECKGDHVLRYTVHNEEIRQSNTLSLARNVVWNPVVYRKVRKLIRQSVPHVVHVHNYLPLLSPSVCFAAKAEGVAVVQGLHNYRLLCVNALFFRAGSVCEQCMGRWPWPGVLHGCYRGSRPASAAVAFMLGTHRLLRTWNRMVDVFIALSEFARRKFVEGGLPPEKIVVKPNFVHPDPGAGRGEGGYALFVGRLVPEKGVETLLRAWRTIGAHLPLKIVGDGPLATRVAEAARELAGVEWLGRRPVREVYGLMGEAAVVLFPSEWYETFGRVAIEAFAKGTPVVASDIGAIAELVEHGRTGLLFHPGDPDDLAAKVEWLVSHPRELARMRQEARAEYERKYTAERNYQMLMEIYEMAIENHHRGR